MNLKIYTIVKIYFLYLFSTKHREFYKFLLKNLNYSKSQVFQDLFVLYFLKKKSNGFFIEIGGGNGVDLSNTYLLEKKYGWSGIICEPNKKNQILIKKYRKNYLEKKPLDNRSSKRIFFESEDSYLSSLNYKEKYVKKYSVKTISLEHLFKKRKIKKVVDYISIDTEGNEFDIIKNFSFIKYKVNIISIEHNFEYRKRFKINKLLNKYDYKRMFKNISYMDDWYIKKNILKNFND